ncbi:hypothetical protein DB30_01297 [Enhygromyxa salina]|uniref:Uncharacterized protein n=1 Tax=Enhygromyxa salina TaxID=215803 RepID=A0A0C2CSA9_9BACT|nr:hypothetical protein DB30_01297 [Enhygromyxa salina]
MATRAGKRRADVASTTGDSYFSFGRCVALASLRRFRPCWVRVLCGPCAF